MKLNLPSTLTNRRMSVLFLLTFLKINRAKAGQDFNGCLHYDNFENVYNYLSNFSFNNNNAINNGGVLYLCCDDVSGCYPSQQLNNCTNNNEVTSVSFYCKEVSQTIYCNGDKCGGIVGNTSIITNTTIGLCPEISTTASFLASNPQFQREPGPFSIHWQCPRNITDICWNLGWCNWDNGGWTCDSFTVRNHSYNNDNSDCILQWTASSPFPSSLSSTSTLASFSSSPDTPPYLIEEITIPVVVVGIGSLSGLTYYLIRKRRKQKTNSTHSSNDLNPIVNLYEENQILNEIPTTKPDEIILQTLNQTEQFQKPEEREILENKIEIPPNSN